VKYSRIAGTGSQLPDKVVTNHDLEKTIETNDQWIRERTGIRERRVAVDGETTGTLALGACRKALEAAAVDPGEIDLGRKPCRESSTGTSARPLSCLATARER
jgi:3-oxoacyl-[acyl-carrier-protein] synthase-3